MLDLDFQKQESLEKNFKKLADCFSEIFKRIVTNGTGTLKLIKNEVKDESQASRQSQVSGESQFLKLGNQVYKGIQVKVSFSGQESSLVSLNHLSGGQKAVVAVSLLFAIQKIDPAPFYIFDEFDSALDSEYRSAIADLIREFAKDSQFLITTFKPELVGKAEKIYEVDFKHKVSQLTEIREDRALHIVKECERQEDQENRQ